MTANFPTDCASCHNENAWVPSSFDHDGLYFPIYSGEHEGEWNACTDCHNNPNNYAVFTCLTCHTNPQTNNEHNGVGGYSYNSPACLACHPQGEATASSFNHNATAFPITGAHQGLSCAECHSAGYQGTPTACAACHNAEYQAATDPNHVALGLSTDCAACHTTAAGWAPATFAVHNNYYPLTGAHASIANDCAECHSNGYTNTPNTCNGCHNSNYTSAANPNHVALGLSTDCASCHTTAPGWSPATFAVHNNYYPLTGAHAAIANDCAQCHAGGNYNNTPNDCNGCHASEYNSASNPNHVSLGLSTNCVTCHTTDPGWAPATFPNHNTFYALVGAHAAIANDCAACHNGNYTNTPNTCYGCHATAYNTANSPNHISAGFPTDCVTCHGQSQWTPANWDHDNMYFPIFSGKHEDEWNQCSDCHTNSSNYSIFTCFTCHSQSETNSDHNGVSGYQYNSNACYACHPNGED